MVQVITYVLPDPFPGRPVHVNKRLPSQEFCPVFHQCTSKILQSKENILQQASIPVLTDLPDFLRHHLPPILIHVIDSRLRCVARHTLLVALHTIL